MNAKIASTTAIIGAALLCVPSLAHASCPNPDPGEPDYKSPSAMPACTQGDLYLFAKQLTSTTDYSDIEAAIAAQSPPCASCIFTPESSPSWGPVVIGRDRHIFLNFGACLELVSGSAACGAAHTKWNTCRRLRCEIDACSDQASATMCGNTVSDDPTSCGRYKVLETCPTIAADKEWCSDLVMVAGVVCGETALPPKSSADRSSPPPPTGANAPIPEPEPEAAGTSSGGRLIVGTDDGGGCAQAPTHGGAAEGVLLAMGIATLRSRRRRPSR